MKALWVAVTLLGMASFAQGQIASEPRDHFHRTERLLADRGWDGDRIVEEELAWVSVATVDGSLLVALYRRTDDTVTRLTLLHSGAGEVVDVFYMSLPVSAREQLKLAEQVLASLPQACGKSYGVLAREGDADVRAVRLDRH